MAFSVGIVGGAFTDTSSHTTTRRRRKPRQRSGRHFRGNYGQDQLPEGRWKCLSCGDVDVRWRPGGNVVQFWRDKSVSVIEFPKDEKIRAVVVNGEDRSSPVDRISVLVSYCFKNQDLMKGAIKTYELGGDKPRRVRREEIGNRYGAARQLEKNAAHNREVSIIARLMGALGHETVSDLHSEYVRTGKSLETLVVERGFMRKEELARLLAGI